MLSIITVSTKDRKNSEHDQRGRKLPHADRWFDAQLTRMYTDIANEPLPDDLDDLVRKLIAKADGIKTEG